jgi:hypothetical protein
MGWYVPLFGGGELVRREADLGPPARHSTLDEIETAVPGARRLAAALDSDDSQLLWQRETVGRMAAQLVGNGESPERAREISVAAARRHDGEAVTYTAQRS